MCQNSNPTRQTCTVHAPAGGTGNSCLRDDPDASMICYSEEAGTEHFNQAPRAFMNKTDRRPELVKIDPIERDVSFVFVR